MLAVATLAGLGSVGAQSTDVGGHPDLYRIRLFPAPDLKAARGTVALARPQSPFGVAVSPDGHHRYELNLEIENLPDPASLGDYTTFVAWATTPILRPLIKLGEVGNGSHDGLGPVSLNKFLIWISAESSADVEERLGRLVLRGASPATRLQPDAHLMLSPVRPPAAKSEHTHESSFAGVTDAGEPPRWTHPPMHPLVTMIPGLEDLRPGLTPFLPRVEDESAVPFAEPRQVVVLSDGQTLELEAAPVRRAIHGRTYVMYGFNGQYPGPLIRVEQSATITVNFRNETELPTAIHWHGVRLDNRYDGVPGVTQDPVEPGESFRYHIFFRDAGLYWYHPHHREDIQQDLGLYGNMLVRAPEPDFFNEVHREEILMLDDLLIGEDGLIPFGEERATHALMGRFGNVLLVNGEPEYSIRVRRGEVVRFFLTNVSNTRTFNLLFDGAPIKVIGSDLGKFERESRADSVTIAPAERYIVEVQFAEAREHPLTNRVQVLDHTFGSFHPEVLTLGRILVEERRAEPDLSATFSALREHPDVQEDIARYREHFGRPVDHHLLFTLSVEGLPPRLMQRIRADTVYFNPVEWGGTMPMMNWLSTTKEVAWLLRDEASGKTNMDIDWGFRLGDVVKLRLTNDRDAIHAMQHPFHIHGQRFLVLSRNGTTNQNLVWKDTVVVAVGEVVDLLLEISNPGRWMAHCHIAEHLETGMKLVFDVQP